MATKAEKRIAAAQRMAGIRHRLFGLLGTSPAPGTAFDPLHYLTDPGRLRDLLEWFRYRAGRAGVGSGLPRALRESAIEDAAQGALERFIDRDYRAEGITADEPARAILGTARYMDRAHWRNGNGRRQEDRKWTPYNRGQNSKSANPAAIVAASLNAAEDRAALTGEGCDETMRLGTVAIPGGAGRPLGEGKMVRTERIVRDWVEFDPETGERRELAEVETGWRMDRRYGFRQEYPASTVAYAADGTETRRFNPPAPPSAGIPSLPHGERVTMRPGDGPAYAADPVAYREALREYYASR